MSNLSNPYRGRHRAGGKMHLATTLTDTLPAPVDPWAATDPNLATRRGAR